MRFVKKIFILPIRLYQLTLSPLLGAHCRHTPSCSQYTIEAISEWGPLKGIWLGMKRIARCHPWGLAKGAYPNANRARGAPVFPSPIGNAHTAWRGCRA